MGVDTRLVINSQWEVEDIVTVLKEHLAIKAKIKSNTKIHSTYFDLICDNGRMIHLHFCYETPLGTATLLSLRANDEAHTMLKGIAKIIGGYFSPEDYRDDNWEDFRGMIWESDGLTYHYKYAILHNQLSDNNDYEGLGLSIEKWNESLKKNR